MTADLLLICLPLAEAHALRRDTLTLGAGVHKHFRNHAGEEESEQTQREAEVGPIVSVFHNLQGIALEVDSTIKVQLVECFHRNRGFAVIFSLVILTVEV